MTENTIISPEETKLPPFDPDKDLMADLEGNARALRAYRKGTDALLEKRIAGERPSK